MKSDTQSIYDLFERSRRYVVPLYQRHYVWSKENHWEPLWEDVLSKTMDRLERKESAPHFMGAMVFAQVSTYGQTDSGVYGNRRSAAADDAANISGGVSQRSAENTDDELRRRKSHGTF